MALPGSWPTSPDDGGGNGPTLGDIYKVAVEEYRFQAQFNWSRTQYLLALNVAVLTAATVLSTQPGQGASIIFIFGAVVALLTMLAINAQHNYYRAARDHMRRVELEVNLPDSRRLDSTATLGHRWRLVSVNQLTYVLLTGAVVGNVTGALVVLLGR